MRRLAMLLAVLFAVSCAEGPTGPQGPPGATGPQGPPGQDGRDGSTIHIVRSGQLNSSGAAAVSLPPEAGTLADPPTVSCWISSSTGGPYLQIATDLQSASCGMGSASDGSLLVSIILAPANWYYIVVAVK